MAAKKSLFPHLFAAIFLPAFFAFEIYRLRNDTN